MRPASASGKPGYAPNCAMLLMTSIDKSVDKTGCISEKSVLVMVLPWVEGLILELVRPRCVNADQTSPGRVGSYHFRKGE